jgi:hypothetical protein
MLAVRLSTTLNVLGPTGWLRNCGSNASTHPSLGFFINGVLTVFGFAFHAYLTNDGAGIKLQMISDSLLDLRYHAVAAIVTHCATTFLICLSRGSTAVSATL